jgi:hypothetical protein
MTLRVRELRSHRPRAFGGGMDFRWLGELLQRHVGRDDRSLLADQFLNGYPRLQPDNDFPA